ncbi:MAG: efflux RND transporter periplasmic adaptor subunit [Burkholderiales bacterium]|nr:efflux RND transporter periplasmic adaptor subunit [Burkholderiales bacterium]
MAVPMLNACGKTNSQSSNGAPPPPQVSVATVIEKEVNEWDEFTGRLQAIERVEIRPRVSGYIERLNFTQGAEVRKGDLLFEIDPKPAQAELARAQAELARAETRADLARSELVRADKLHKARAISQQEYDQWTNGRQDSVAAVKAAEAMVRIARLNLDYTKIRSPIDGRTSFAEVTVGNLVTGGNSGAPATLLTSVVSIDPIYAYFEGDEQIYLKYAELGRSGERASSRTTKNPIYLGLANEQGHPHQGYVDFVDNALNPETGTIRARAVFDNKERKFTPGLFARLKLVGSGTYQAILINDRAVGTDQSKKFVLVVGADNKAVYREVKLGPMIDGLRVVRQGLKGDEVIVVNGLQRVKPGDAVTPQQVTMLEADKPAGAPGANDKAPSAATDSAKDSTTDSRTESAPGSAPEKAPAAKPAEKPVEQPADKKAEARSTTKLAGRAGR